MDKSAAAQALLSLAKEGKGRTKTARLREILGEIETAQQAGVSNARIVETLNAQGFDDLTLKTFETMLYRIRKKQRQTTATPAGLGHDQGKPPATSTPEAQKVGAFEIPKPKRFTHNPTPDDDQLT